MSWRTPLPVVVLSADDLALFSEFDLDAGPVAVDPELLRLAAGAAAEAARSGPVEERAFARGVRADLNRAPATIWRCRDAVTGCVRLPAATKAQLAASGIGRELVLAHFSTLIAASWYLPREPAAAAWIEPLRELVESWLRVFASGDEEARG